MRYYRSFPALFLKPCGLLTTNQVFHIPGICFADSSDSQNSFTNQGVLFIRASRRVDLNGLFAFAPACGTKVLNGIQGLLGPSHIIGIKVLSTKYSHYLRNIKNLVFKNMNL